MLRAETTDSHIMIVERLNIGCLTRFVLYASIGSVFSLPDLVRDCIIDRPKLAMMLRVNPASSCFVANRGALKRGALPVAYAP